MLFKKWIEALNKGKTILLAGATGYIGKAVLAELRLRQYLVVCIGRNIKSTTVDSWEMMYFIENWDLIRLVNTSQKCTDHIQT